MGGDYAPDAIVQDALSAYAELRVDVTLVGDQNLIWKQIREQGRLGNGIQIRHCSQVVAMDESPVKVLRQKEDASISVAFELAKKGEAEAVVSAGNSGASIGAAILALGRIRGVETKWGKRV